MKIFDRIKQDHEVQRNLMETIVETEGDSEKRNNAFAKLRDELRAHAAAEEQVFYSVLMKDDEGTDKSRHSIAEHKDTLDLVDELNTTSMSSPGWLQKFKKLKEENEHHMDEEENEVFLHAKKILSEKVLEDMHIKFNEHKQHELA